MTTTTTAMSGRLVSKKHVDELVRNYKKQRWVLNSERIGKPDSLSTTFNLENLSAFLEKAKKANADSIRVYFGVYPEKFEENPSYGERQTVVLVATKKSPNALGEEVDKEVYIRIGENYDILAFNLGNICPPDCGSGLPDQNDLGSIGITIFTNKDGMSVG